MSEADAKVLIRAAGGLVWREGPEGPEVALVHRPRYDDWTLPKGKLEQEEPWADAALREVEEETGCQCSLGVFAGVTSYNVGDRPKIVAFWEMDLKEDPGFEPNDEVDRVMWLEFEAAAAQLTHADERRVLAEAVFRRH